VQFQHIVLTIQYFSTNNDSINKTPLLMFFLKKEMITFIQQGLNQN